MTLSQSIQISLCFSITVVYDAKVGKKNEKNFDPSQIPDRPVYQQKEVVRPRETEWT